MKWSRLFFIYLLFFGAAVFYKTESSYLLLLTAAQIVYVPITIQMIGNKNGWSAFLAAIPPIASVIILAITSDSSWEYVFAAIYLLFTIAAAIYGIKRILSREFFHIEEFMIDIGLIYLSIGGLWFFAHIGKIETGFSPMITWLTAIHFHYSAFLLPVFCGFLGRVYKPKDYWKASLLILLSPIVLAAGITFSAWIEVASVILYMIGIYSIIHFAFKAPFTHPVQKWLIRISFSSLGITIIFSFLYAIGQVWSDYSLSIDFMLWFHGLFNCVIFALFGVIGWSINLPEENTKERTFPVSAIRGKLLIGDSILPDIMDEKSTDKYKGLVDDMRIYEEHSNQETIAPAILDFYENTLEYRLSAKVEWKSWFQPFAAVYRLFSRITQQINLPLSKKQVEMTGGIYAVNDEIDGRCRPRAWVRKIGDETVFVALYSCHKTNGQAYMNIALPLPWSSMIGILKLNQVGEELELTSQKTEDNSDAGIYLKTKMHLFVLPIEETFRVKDAGNGKLTAQHDMWIFSIPFLTIHYEIGHKSR